MFQKGKPKTGGRKKGVQNKSTTELGQFFRDILETPAWRAKWRVYFRDAPLPRIPRHLLELAFFYGYGKPHDKIDIGNGPDPFDFTLTIDSNGV